MHDFKDPKKIYVIAEIGHNHQGSIKKAYELFKQAKLAGANAVKLQKRDNKTLFTKSFYNQPYTHPNSYAKTYGLHREKLEFGVDEYLKLKKYAQHLKIDFFATPFDLSSVQFLKKINMKYYKIASADLSNPILQEAVAKVATHVFQSTGAGTLNEIENAKKIIFKNNKNLTIMHCTASYPCNITDMNLRVVKTLKQKFKDCSIGLSDHENGIDAGPLSYMMGARVFEKHFTLNRANKGTDHAFSLEPTGLQKFIRNILRVEKMLGSNKKSFLNSEKKPIFKMRKSIVAANTIKKGSYIMFKDLAFKAPGDGLKPSQYKKIVKKKAKTTILPDELITFKKIS
jgi:sialic acid synthase